jgi:hypothetical protein
VILLLSPAVGGRDRKIWLSLAASSSGSRKVNIAMSGYAGRFGLLLVFPGLISVIPMWE